MFAPIGFGSTNSSRLRPNVPMAIQVANHLRRQLRLEYADGGRLPSENEMAAELGVSRGTVRQALAILQQEGFISRHQGLGTFANPKVLGITARIDFAYEFSELIKEAGFEPSFRLLDSQATIASPEAVKRLYLEPGEPVIVMTKLIMANEQPAIYVREEVPVSLIPTPYEPAEMEQSLFYFLERHCKLELNYVLSEIIPSLTEGDAAKQLDTPAGSAVLKFVEVFFGEKDQPFVLATILFREPLIRFHALRKIVPLD
jgi:GntR family transcriptional regulator